MAYENLALKYRPKILDDIVGQDTFVRTIKNAVESGRIARAFLFYGPRGCGKTSSARILAKTLNCHKLENNNPCGQCPSCLEISQSRSLDVLEIDAASHTQVQNVRDVIIDNINIAPSRDKYKIYILDEVHMLSNSAFNALLKTVEEPPAHAVFIMATTEINKVPATIVSRCQTFRFKPISTQQLKDRLIQICQKENFEYQDRALEMIASSCGGAMRDAITILDRIASFSKGKIDESFTSETLGLPPSQLVENLAVAVLNRSAASINSIFKEISKEGFEAFSILRELRNYFAQAFFVSNNFSSSTFNVPQGHNPYVFAKLARKMNRIMEELRFSDNPLLSLEMALYTVIETPVDIEALVKRLESAESAIYGNYTTPPSFQSVEKKGIDDPGNNLPEKKTEILEPAVTCTHSHQIWQKAVEIISSQDPALSNFLLDCNAVFRENEWELRFEKDFPRVYCEKKSEYISSVVSKISGKPISLLFKTKPSEDKIIEVSNVVSNKNNQDSNQQEDTLNWQDVNSQDQNDIFPEYKKISRVFKDSLVRVHKLQKGEKKK